MFKKMVKFIVFLSLFAISAEAGLNQDQKVLTSINILQNYDLKIPANVLKNAKAIAIIPNLKSGGFVIAETFGKGILSVKQNDGEWSDPIFVTFTNLRVGLIAGISSTDAIIIFKTRRSLDGIKNNKWTFGLNVGATIIKNGREVSRKTDANLAANIYLYGKSSGLMLNYISLGSGMLSIDDESNDKYYNTLTNAEDLIEGYANSKKPEVKKLKKILTNLTN